MITNMLMTRMDFGPKVRETVFSVYVPAVIRTMLSSREHSGNLQEHFIVII